MTKIQNRIISFFLRHPNFFFLYVNTYFPFSDQFLSKYGHVVNWNIISYNISLIRNWDFIDKYKDVLNWDNLSLEDIGWNEKMVDHYIDKLLWKSKTWQSKNEDYYYVESFCANPSFNWNQRLINKYKHLIDWYDLSQNEGEFWNEALLEEYEEYLNWEKLSFNPSIPFTLDLLQKYNKNWDWDLLLNNAGVCSKSDIIEKYQNRISWFNVCLSQNEIINEEFLKRWNLKINWNAIAMNKHYVKSMEVFNRHLDKWHSHNSFSALSCNENLPWSVDFIEQYFDKWDWEDLSSNDGLPWTINFIDKFEDFIYFGHNEKISEYEESMIFGVRILEDFPWGIDLLEKYEHKWDFDDFIQNKGLWNKAFKPYVNQDMINLIFRILV